MAVTVTAPPAEKPAADRPKDPPFGVGVPASASAKLPRECKELERAAKGQVRFKIRCKNYESQKARYVLVADGEKALDQAVECYAKVGGLADEVARQKKIDPASAVEPDYVVTRLPD